MVGELSLTVDMFTSKNSSQRNTEIRILTKQGWCCKQLMPRQVQQLHHLQFGCVPSLTLQEEYYSLAGLPVA